MIEQIRTLLTEHRDSLYQTLERIEQQQMALQDQITELTTLTTANTAATQVLVAQEAAGAPDDPNLAAALTQLAANNTALQGLEAPATPPSTDTDPPTTT